LFCYIILLWISLTDGRFGRVPGAVGRYRASLPRRQTVQIVVVLVVLVGVDRLGPEFGPVEPGPHGAEKVAFLLPAPAAIAWKTRPNNTDIIWGNYTTIPIVIWAGASGCQRVQRGDWNLSNLSVSVPNNFCTASR